jgi:4-hydroxy-3-methylbut-2-enyl diphosphate reductase
MIVKLAEYYGLCFGVRDALKQAEQLAQHGPLTILGELVHNPVVRDQLARQGVQEGRLDDFTSVSTPQVMITAHGASDAKRREWKSAGFGIADGTCPLVRHAHAQLRMLVQTGYFPVVIGQRGHVEVQGLIGDFPSAVVVENETDLANLPLHSRLGIISQTTQPIEKVRFLVAQIRSARPAAEVRFCDTVCKPTKDRQAALQKLLSEVDVVVVVGGRNSNNTRQLVSASQAAGRIVFHIERAEELREEWFEGVKSVGITAGTSTLQETVLAVNARLQNLTRQSEAIPADAP